MTNKYIEITEIYEIVESTLETMNIRDKSS